MYDVDQACRRLMENIRNLCIQRQMTMYHLACESHISQSTLSDLFRGKTKPQVYTLFKICNALEVDIEKLLEGIFFEETLPEGSDDVKKKQLSELLQTYEYLTEDKRQLVNLYADMIRKYDDIDKIEKTIGDSKNRTTQQGGFYDKISNNN